MKQDTRTGTAHETSPGDGSDSLSQPCTSRRVLWIDDERDAVTPIIRELESAGWTVQLATDAEAGLSCARRSPCDVLLVDLVLPGASGLDLVRSLRRLGHWTSVVILTGYGTLDAGFEAARLGVHSVLTKPVRGAELDAVLRIAAGKGTGSNPFLFRPIGMGAPPNALRNLLQLKAHDATHCDSDETIEKFTLLLAQLIADSQVTFVEFVTAASALNQFLSDPRARSQNGLANLLQRLMLASEINSEDVDEPIRRAIEGFQLFAPRQPTPEVALITHQEGLGPNELSDLMQRFAGLSLKSVRRAVIVRRAVLALAESDEHVAQIAYSIGVEEPGNLDHDFKAVVGTTPTIFRRMLARLRTTRWAGR